MINITKHPIDIWKVLQSVEDEKAGGHAHFVGTIRRENGIDGIEYECYEEMALRKMEEIVAEAGRRWPIEKLSAVHRYGWIPVGEAAVVVAVACGHRAEAFEACRFAIDQIKAEVPIWKVGHDVYVHGNRDATRLGGTRCHPERNEGSPAINFQEIPHFVRDDRSNDSRPCCMTHITGVILAGGFSSRFGSNKALAPFRGRPVIETVVEEMKKVFEKLLIVTNTPEEYRFLNLPLLTDEMPHLGPLGGIVTALEHVETDQIFVVACDMPRLDEEAIRRVVEKCHGADAAVAVHGDRREHLLAVYSKKLLPLMRQQLVQREYSLKNLCSKIDSIVWAPVEGNVCVNVNHPQDLVLLEERNYSRPPQ